MDHFGLLFSFTSESWFHCVNMISLESFRLGQDIFYMLYILRSCFGSRNIIAFFSGHMIEFFLRHFTFVADLLQALLLFFVFSLRDHIPEHFQFAVYSD